MTDLPALLWLDDARATDAALVGPKAARLAALCQAGARVPNGFVLTTHASILEPEPSLRTALLRAYRRLAPDAVPVAVRSSAVAEDLAGASFAGMQATVLNVVGALPLLEAVRRVAASGSSAEARAYRARVGVAEAGMAVLVQRQVAARVAGVAFAHDPLTGEAATVIEAVAGLGEALVSGAAEPQRWRILSGQVVGPTGANALLNPIHLREIAERVAWASDFFGVPQDVEWARDGATLWLLQARPITTPGDVWFTEPDAGDYLWTAAFLNERFTQPVSPLGWTLVAGPLERLALCGPLELLGATDIEGPLLRRWRGHPYSRVEGWQRVYKLFPDALLPDDAARFFPDGDVTLRRAPRRPTLGPRLVLNGLRTLRTNFGAASPLHNPRAWRRWEQWQAASLIRLRFEERQLARLVDPLPTARALLREAAILTDELLELHRWSLLYADLFYSLLRRALLRRYGAEEGAAHLAALARRVAGPTTQMNRALETLAAEVAAHPLLARWLEAQAAGDTGPVPTEVRDFGSRLARFLEAYGHRSFSLDLYDPPWEADRPSFAYFLLTLAETQNEKRKTQSGNISRQASSVHAPFIIRLLSPLVLDYLYLREAQRFRWQEVLAVQRRVAVGMGEWWVARGMLAGAEDVFCLAWDELLGGEPDGARAAARMTQLRRLRAEAATAPAWHYPAFLRGDAPLRADVRDGELRGHAVSPGLAQGRARLVATPSDLVRLRPGDVLVTASPDPGWTPLFGTVAALVTERGGQLSHGAVVAREYGLPAVSGIPGLLATLQEGELLLVDGTRGVVVRLGAGQQGDRNQGNQGATEP